MRVRFWGTRGSIATPGPGTNYFGGNTSCVELTTANGDLLIIDCGTGMHPLAANLMAQGKKAINANILIGHTHWDHIQGFPFFSPAFVKGNSVAIHGPEGSHGSLHHALAGVVVLALSQEGIRSGKESPRLAVVSDASECLGHPVASDHATRDVSDAAKVIRRTGRKMIEHESLGRTPAEQHRHFILEFGSGHQEAVLGWALNGVPQCPNSSWNDRDLVHHINTRK